MCGSRDWSASRRGWRGENVVLVEDGPLNQAGDADVLSMRAQPPGQTLRWLVEAMDAEGVVAVNPMPGGSTSAMHRVTLRRASGVEVSVVMRRYVLSKVLAEDPDIAAHELRALQLVEPLSVPTPQPLAADPYSRETDAPTVVMSLLHGRPDWGSRSRRRWLEQLADAIVEVHSVQLPTDTLIPRIERYEQAAYAPPRWTRRPTMWERAIQIFHGPIPDADTGFVHRDFHPGNLLWRRGHLTGLVDWQAACVGPASIDVGHCRLNMLYYDPPLAEDLRVAWEQRSGLTYHPWADVISIIGVLDNLRTRNASSTALDAIEDTLTRAVASLTN